MTAARRRQTLADMARSLGLVLAVVGVVFLLAQPQRGASRRVRTVDFGADVRAVVGSAPYPVVAPTGLPTGWRATSSRASIPELPGGPVGLHVGFVTPAGRYAALEESNAPPEGFLVSLLSQGPTEGTVDIAGQPWERRRDRDGQPALRRTVGGATVVLVGTAGLGELGTLAGSLR